jgi:hypothetical protein
MNLHSSKSHKYFLVILFCLIIFFTLPGCKPLNGGVNQAQSQQDVSEGTPIPTKTFPPTSFPIIDVRLFFAGEVPPGLKDAIKLPEGVIVVNNRGEANVILEQKTFPQNPRDSVTDWRYVLAAPFPEVSADPEMGCIRAYADPSTSKAFSAVKPAKIGCDEIVATMNEDLTAAVYKDPGSVVLRPFEELNPHWQAIGVDPFGSPDLVLRFGLSGDPEAIQALTSAVGFYLPAGNFNPQKLASVILTGTTALTRGTGVLMDEKGVAYPSEAIGDLLRSADITHISNEISFKKNCELEKSGTKFCSKVPYFDLLKLIGTDVVELTGNHVMDYGAEPFLETLALYSGNGMQYYGGGPNLQSAGTPLKLDVKGNRIAFIGCNAVGPDTDLATDTSPGSNPCDMSIMKLKIAELKSEGYNPIVTFQHMEVCQTNPEPPQRGDFFKTVQAGAVIVSGSQAHCPQNYEFIGDTFVHYGLGNLFFDQMDKIERMAFIDQYLFYDNRLLGVNPIGIIRVDEAQPQLMTGEELQNFINKYYSALDQKR